MLTPWLALLDPRTVQTLGHLGQMLQWPRFLGLRDTTEVLLAEWPETYAMLEKVRALDAV